MLVEYDPIEVSASDLLHLWSSSHDSSSPAPAPHFRSAVLCTSPSQYALACSLLSSPRFRERHRCSEVVESFAGPFYRAEEVQQNYMAKGDGAGMS